MAATSSVIPAAIDLKEHEHGTTPKNGFIEDALPLTSEQVAHRRAASEAFMLF